MLLSLRMWFGRKIFGVIGDRYWPAGILISPKRVVKWPCEAPEVEALRYVAANTTIPIPRVYRVHRWHGKLGIEMEFLKGCTTLHAGWRTLTDEQKQQVVNDISAYIRQLRSLESGNKHRVSSTDGGPCRDIRIASVKLFGPFDNSDGFHQCVRGGSPLEMSEYNFGDKIARIHERKYETRYTHGDLAVLNILIRDAKIVAVIDWECAGWYPEYWEYTKAHYNRVLLPEFYKMLDEQIDRYDNELDAERVLWEIFDQPLDQTGC